MSLLKEVDVELLSFVFHYRIDQSVREQRLCVYTCSLKFHYFHFWRRVVDILVISVMFTVQLPYFLAEDICGQWANRRLFWVVQVNFIACRLMRKICWECAQIPKVCDRRWHRNCCSLMSDRNWANLQRLMVLGTFEERGVGKGEGEEGRTAFRRLFLSICCKRLSEFLFYWCRLYHIVCKAV